MKRAKEETYRLQLLTRPLLIDTVRLQRVRKNYAYHRYRRPCKRGR